MPRFETPEDEPGVMSAKEFLARGRKKKKGADSESPKLRERIVSIDVVGDSSGNSIAAAALLAKLLDREGVPYNLVFSAPNDRAAFEESKERTLEDLVLHVRALQDVALRHDLVPYRERKDWAESKF